MTLTDATTLTTWDAVTGESGTRTLEGEPTRYYHGSMTPDRLLLQSQKGGPARLFTLPEGRLLEVLPDHDSPTTAVALSRDGRWAALASEDFRIRLVDTVTGQGVFTLAPRNPAIQTLQFTADGRWLLAGTGGKVLTAIDLGSLWDELSALGL